jgi:flavin-dependent dehydrogenase
MRRLAAGLRDERESEAGGRTRESRAEELAGEPEWYARGFALEATVPYSALAAKLPAGDAAEDLVFDFAPIRGGYGWMFPKGDHINIGVGAFVTLRETDGPGRAGESVTRGLLASYARAKLGVELEQIAGAHVTGQYLGLGGHAYVPRGRVLLAGDAAGLVDPLTGEGIHSAVVSGQAAAAAVLTCGDDRRWADVAERYAEGLRELQETLAFSQRAAQRFYREPGRGFRVMRMPLLRRLVLKTYADGLPHTKLLAGLARRVA